jgi:hypothetical protein
MKPRMLGRLVLAMLFSFLGACFSAPAFGQAPAPAPAPPPAPALLGEIRTGIYRGRPVVYEMRDGKAIYEGDIVLENVIPGMTSKNQRYSFGIAYPQYLWLKVGSVYQIPYTITNPATNLTAAINAFNATFNNFIHIQVRNGETDYVDFNFDLNNHNGTCDAIVGRAGGKQEVGGSVDCSVGTLLHELGHTVGLWHEQSRPDRDTYVNVLYQNIIKGSRFNFDQVLDNSQTFGPYDYSSVMHYIPFAFTRNGGPTIESKPPGIPLSNLTGYTAADIDGIDRLYGAAPTMVTITSNPPGLQVIVDSNPITTPQTFSFALNSVHHLDIPSTGAQTLAGTVYTYGRWNDNTAAMHDITITPGSGLVAEPATSPAITVYTANFIQLVQFTQAVTPGGSGTMMATPAAQSFPPAPGVYYVNRQPVTLQAAANSGFTFYAWWGVFNPFSFNANPLVVFNPASITAAFSSSPVYTITSNPPGNTTPSNPGALGVMVDSTFWYAPKNFSSDFDAGWGVSSSHTISVDSPQLPYSINTQFVFDNWSDSGAQTHMISAPAVSTTYTANLTPQYVIADFVLPGCAGTAIGIVPPPNNGMYYSTGTQVTFTETPNSGWTFTGWLYDLSGTSPMDMLTVSDEVLVDANYNISSTPLAVTSLSPPTAPAGGSGFTLTINGAGFTSGSIVFVNNVFVSSTFVNSGEITVPITAANIATAGAFQVGVSNFPSMSPCSAFAALPFFVTIAPPMPAVSLSATTENFGNEVINGTSPSKMVTLSNTGTATLTITSITSSGDFGESDNCAGSVLAGGHCTLTLTFTPSVLGALSGALTIVDNAVTSPQLISFSGSGIAPLSITPATLAFGTVTVGNTSSSKTATLMNNTASSLSISFSASGDYVAVGNGTSPCGSTLNANAKCTIGVTFHPHSNGSTNGSVAVTFNGSLSPQILALSGTGSGGATAPLTFSPASLSIASTLVGTTSPAKTVTVTNTGATSITLSSLSASGDFAAMGSGTSPCGGALAAGAKCTFTVTFSPSYSGSTKGSVTITDTAPVSPQVYDVSGTGVLPVSLSPSSLTFPAQTVGTSSPAKTVMLTNNLSTMLTITGIVASGDYSISTGTNACSGTLLSLKKCTIYVVFSPTATGSIKGAVTVTYTGSFSPQEVKLTGTGQ